VELLLPKEEKIYTQENGVGLTAVDCAMLKLLSPFHGISNPENRRSHNSNQPISHLLVPEKKCHSHLMGHLKKQRVIVKDEDVTRVTEMMINQANHMVDNLANHSRRRFQQAEDDALQQTDTHISISFPFSIIPEAVKEDNMDVSN